MSLLQPLLRILGFLFCNPSPKALPSTLPQGEGYNNEIAVRIQPLIAVRGEFEGKRQ